MVSFIKDIDILVGHTNDSDGGENIQHPDPVNWTKITPNLNIGNSGAAWPFLFVQSTPEINLTDDFVTDIKVVAGSHQELSFIPDYTVIPVDCNKGAGGDYVYVHKKREKGKPPLIKVAVSVFTEPQNSIDKEKYIGKLKMIRCNLNSGTSSPYFIYILTQSATDLEYCTALLDRRLTSSYCLTAVRHDKSGDYDDYLRTYCSLDEKKSSNECACVNSPVLARDINPLCLDHNCISNGIPLHTQVLGSECNITDCSIVYDIEAKGDVKLANNYVYQECDKARGTGETIIDTRPPNASTIKNDRDFYPWYQKLSDYVQTYMLEFAWSTITILAIIVIIVLVVMFK